ncbi:LytR/AlgR family response regulator transcription factor [Bacteroidota bacterium]
MKHKCIIVDDEPLARQVLRGFIGSMESLELVKECGNSMEAASFLHENIVDIMFLDIKMPGLSGMEFLRTLIKAPSVIITSAYSEYALEGYEYSVTDYILKPFSFERFLKAVNKALDKKKNFKQVNVNNEGKHAEFIFLKTDKSEVKINLKDIIYFEAYGNYVKVYTVTKTILVSQTMKSIETNIPSDDFIRIHKSFIVSFDKVDKLEGNSLKIMDKKIPVGKYYKRNLEEAIKHFSVGK